MALPVRRIQITNTPRVIPSRPQTGNRGYGLSHDWCDKTTWYTDAVLVSNELVGTGDGTQTTFSLANGNVIDVTHGKIPGESPYLSAYAPTITVGGVEKTEHEFLQSNGDYSIQYANGDITFDVAPASGEEVRATYHYSPPNAGSTAKFGPGAGKKWIVDKVEIQFSKDIDLQDTVIVAIFDGTDTEKSGTRVEYKTKACFDAFAYGSHPVIPAFGGTDRGSSTDTMVYRMEYFVSEVLLSSNGDHFRVWNKNHTPHIGEKATITFYALEEDE